MARNRRWVEAGLPAFVVGLDAAGQPAAGQTVTGQTVTGQTVTGQTAVSQAPGRLPRPDDLLRETAVMCAGLNLAFAGTAEPQDAPIYRDRALTFGQWAGEFGATRDIAAAIEESRLSFVESVKPGQTVTPWSRMMARHGGGYGRRIGHWAAGVIKSAEPSRRAH